jgi:hypothetical protein
MASKKMIVTVMLVALAALAGCSDDNPATPTATIDTAPPAVPANLSVAYGFTQATLTWEMSTVDNDLAGYVVIREHYGMSDTLVSTPRMIDSYVDAAPRPGTSVYNVYAVDNSGNASAVATVALDTPLQDILDDSGAD